jgi:hypothetical protein
MPGSSRQHRSEKRRKELARQAKQVEKRERKTARADAERGAGPPIDWTEAAPGVPVPPTAQDEPAAGEPKDEA